MAFSLIEFLIGLTLLNGMAHIVIGCVKVRFFALFGFSNLSNIVYGLLNVTIALVLFHVKYGLSSIIDHGMVLGALFMIAIYTGLGRFLYERFNQQ
jgi:hypothetical protein